MIMHKHICNKTYIYIYEDVNYYFLKLYICTLYNRISKYYYRNKKYTRLQFVINAKRFNFSTSRICCAIISLIYSLLDTTEKSAWNKRAFCLLKLYALPHRCHTKVTS